VVLLEIACQNRDIIEQAKAHGAVGLRMMPWRTYGTEDLGRLAVHHGISSSQGARYRFQGSVK
jgi:hypothetical protein